MGLTVAPCPFAHLPCAFSLWTFTPLKQIQFHAKDAEIKTQRTAKKNTELNQLPFALADG
jgi:hypothetical protein